jgi:hypothetical protein
MMASRKPSTEIPAKRAAAPLADQRDRQFQTLLRKACVRAAGVGALSSLVGAIPGAGTLLRFTLGELIDVAAITAIQEKLIEDTLALYELPLPAALRKPLITQISALGAGASIGVDAIGRTILGRFASKLGGPLFGRVVPVLSVLTSAVGNAATTYAIGRRAESFAKMGAAPADTVADALRAFTGMDERRIWEWSLTATREALGTLARVTAKVKGMNPFMRGDDEAADEAVVDKGEESTKSASAKPKAARKAGAAGAKKAAAKKAGASKAAGAKPAAKKASGAEASTKKTTAKKATAKKTSTRNTAAS